MAHRAEGWLSRMISRRNKFYRWKKIAGSSAFNCLILKTRTLGIVHIIGPEQGLTQPGMTIVCGDSHTATHGAFGALAFGIGTSEVEHVLATQCLLQREPKTLEVVLNGHLQKGVSAKDIILALISQIGIGGGTGSVIEYRGDIIHSLSMEERMTICNMSIEAGARAGMIAPDDTTYEYLAGRPHAPKGAKWQAALENWKQLPSDAGAVYDQSVQVDVEHLEPMITFGTNPGMGIPITALIPDPSIQTDAGQKAALERLWLIWISNRVCLYWVIRWMWSSSAAAPMAGSVICGQPHPC